mmetsp:Transcript_5966/g.23162  ORF Transcript_5966/g.23162 Transcript_5966/m.23162 type:complete len:226 (-) Transcript_5966:143-820(-)
MMDTEARLPHARQPLVLRRELRRPGPVRRRVQHPRMPCRPLASAGSAAMTSASLTSTSAPSVPCSGARLHLEAPSPRFLRRCYGGTGPRHPCGACRRSQDQAENEATQPIADHRAPNLPPLRRLREWNWRPGCPSQPLRSPRRARDRRAAWTPGSAPSPRAPTAKSRPHWHASPAPEARRTPLRLANAGAPSVRLPQPADGPARAPPRPSLGPARTPWETLPSRL